MSVTAGTTPANNASVGLPPNNTELSFGAVGSPSERVTVDYVITGPANVLFANGTPNDHLDGPTVTSDDTIVRKSVTFQFTGPRPVGTIDITGTVKGVKSGTGFAVFWNVAIAAANANVDLLHVRLDQIVDRLHVLEAQTRKPSKGRAAKKRGGAGRKRRL